MSGITLNIDSNPMELMEELKDQQHYKHMWKKNCLEREEEIKKLKEKLDEWAEADEYIDDPDDLINHLYDLRNEVDDEKERVEELEEENEELKRKLILKDLTANRSE